MSESKDPEANGCLMCNLFRVKNKWVINHYFLNIYIKY